MAEPASSERKRGKVPLYAYVIGSALLWAVMMPLADWVTGDLVHIGPSVLKGALSGIAWGLGMYAIDGWLRRRAE